MNYEILISFIGASMVLTLMPGPDIIYVMVQSMSNGKKYGVILALGLISGILIHTSLVAFGVSALIKQSESIFWVLKLLGAFYLLFLAIKTYLSDALIELKGNVAKKELLKLYKQGFIMNVLNPKVSIFFLAFFPGFLYSDTQNTIVQFYVLGIIFMLQAFIIFSLVAVMSGKFSILLKRYPRLNVTFKWIKIGVLVGITIFILIP